MTQFIELSEDDFTTRFKPIRNHLNESASFDWGDGFGTLFETYDGEYAFVLAQDASKVWTLCSGDDGDHIVNGRHFVNRLGYFVTEHPVPEGVEIQVVLDVF